MHDHFRIESPDLVATNVKVIYVPHEGEEVDISNSVSAVTFEPIDVGSVVQVSLRVFVKSATVKAVLKDVERIGPPKKRRPWHRLRDATRFGDKVRQVEWS